MSKDEKNIAWATDILNSESSLEERAAAHRVLAGADIFCTICGDPAPIGDLMCEECAELNKALFQDYT